MFCGFKEAENVKGVQTSKGYVRTLKEPDQSHTQRPLDEEATFALQLVYCDGFCQTSNFPVFRFRTQEVGTNIG